MPTRRMGGSTRAQAAFELLAQGRMQLRRAQATRGAHRRTSRRVAQALTRIAVAGARVGPITPLMEENTTGDPPLQGRATDCVATPTKILCKD